MTPHVYRYFLVRNITTRESESAAAMGLSCVSVAVVVTNESIDSFTMSKQIVE